MSKAMPNYYMIRAMGQTQPEFDVFFKKYVVAVGWSQVNFSKSEDIEALITKIDTTYYCQKDVSATTAGIKRNEVRRFMGIRPGDRIVVPHYSSICLATVDQSLMFYSDQARSFDLANQLPVEYMINSDSKRMEIPRLNLSTKLQTRLRVPGSTVRDLNEFSNELAPFWDSIGHQGWSTKHSKEKDIAIEGFKARLLEHIQSGEINLKAGGIGLEHLVQELLNIDGYEAKVEGKKRFKGMADADISASIDERIFGTRRLLVQVKHHTGQSDPWGAQQLSDIQFQEPDFFKEHKLVLVTSASASRELQSECNDHQIVLIVGTELVNWIFESIQSLSKDTITKLGIIDVPQLSQ